MAEHGAPFGSGRVLSGLDNPDLVFQACYRVLQANHDPRAKVMASLLQSLY